MSRRRSPFANLAAERGGRSREPRHRHLTSREYARTLMLETLDRHRDAQRQKRAGEEQEEQQLPPQLAVLDVETWLLVRVLRARDGVEFVDDARVTFQAMGTAAQFEEALAELARLGLVEIGPWIGTDGGPSGRGIIRLRMDVDLPRPPKQEP